MCSGIVDGMAKCEKLDQSATLGAGWPGSTLFAQICISKSIGSLWYSYLVVKLLLSVLLWFGVIYVGRQHGGCVNGRRCQCRGRVVCDTGFRHMSPVLASAIVWLILEPCCRGYHIISTVFVDLLLNYFM